MQRFVFVRGFSEHRFDAGLPSARGPKQFEQKGLLENLAII
jgi:hypothetical protein